MNEFGDALKKARVAVKKPLREVAQYIGVSIGYVSDIEQGRKGPPELETVRKLQEFLRVKNNELVALASDLRARRPSEIVQHIQNRPRLSVLLARAKNLSDAELEKLIEKTGGND